MQSKILLKESRNVCMYAIRRWMNIFRLQCDCTRVNEWNFECLHVQYVCLYVYTHASIYLSMYVIWTCARCTIPWYHWILIIFCVFQLILCYLFCKVSSDRSASEESCSLKWFADWAAILLSSQKSRPSIHPPPLISTPLPHHHAYSRTALEMEDSCRYACM